MTTESHNLISGFQALPEPEQREVAAEILRLASHWDSQPPTDEELARSADELFAEIDQRDDQEILPPQEWTAKFRHWADSHKLRNPHVDDSRESVYSGRGE